MTTTVSFASDLISRLRVFVGVFFLGVTYTAKGTGETARLVIRVGQSYANALRADVATVEAMTGLTGVDEQARVEVLASLNKSLAAVEAGTESEDYTKKGKYEYVCNGVRRFEDGTLEVRGFVHSKTVVVAGNYKTVNSRPLTIAKNNIRKLLKISKYRSYCIDEGNLHSVRVSGEELV